MPRRRPSPTFVPSSGSDGATWDRLESLSEAIGTAARELITAIEARRITRVAVSLQVVMRHAFDAYRQLGRLDHNIDD